MRPLIRFSIAGSWALSLALLASATALASPSSSSPAPAPAVSPAAATAAQKEDALSHFRRGKQAIGEKDWRRAELELRASLAIVDSPNARLELARALRDSHALGEAYAEYGRVIESATRLRAIEPRYAQAADAATSERRELEGTLAFLVVTLTHASPGATLHVGGRTVPHEAWNGPIAVDPGVIDLVLSDAAGKELARATVSASAGESSPVTLDAAPPQAAGPQDRLNTRATAETHAAAPAVPDDSEDARSSKERRRKRLRTYAYVAGGVGVAGAGLFAAFGLMSNAAYADLQSACPPPSRQCPPDKQGEISSGKTQQMVANVSLVAGAVALAASATLFVVSMPGRSDGPSGTALVVGPAYVGLRGSL